MKTYLSIFIFFLSYHISIGQEISNLKIEYTIGYSTTKIINKDTLRGTYVSAEWLSFDSNSNKFCLKTYEKRQGFYTYGDEGYSENLLADSVKIIHKNLFSFPKDEVQKFILKIIAQDTNVVISSLESIRDIDNFVKKRNFKFLYQLQDMQKTMLLEDLKSQAMSSIQDDVRIYFKIQNIGYNLIRLGKNPYWIKTSSDSDEKVSIIYTDFDNFLCEKIPDKFDYKNSICDYLSFENLMAWIKMKTEETCDWW